MRRLLNACTKLLSWLANHTKTAVIVLDVIVISSVPLFKWLLDVCLLWTDNVVGLFWGLNVLRAVEPIVSKVFYRVRFGSPFAITQWFSV